MIPSQKTKHSVETIDLLMLWTIAAALGAVLFLLVFFPRYWPWCLWLLDVRIWPPWKCIGVATMLVESLLLIHLWPTKKRRRR